MDALAGLGRLLCNLCKVYHRLPARNLPLNLWALLEDHNATEFTLLQMDLLYTFLLCSGSNCGRQAGRQTAWVKVSETHRQN